MSGRHHRKRIKSRPHQFSQKKENATLAQRIEILDWHHAQDKPSQKKTAEHFAPIYPNLCIKQPLVSTWLSDEQQWREHWNVAQEKGRASNAKHLKQVEHPEIEDMMELWIVKAMRDRVHLTGEVIREKWTRFADLAGIPQEERLALSDGWLTALKRQCGLKELKRHGEAASADPIDIENERKNSGDHFLRRVPSARHFQYG